MTKRLLIAFMVLLAACGGAASTTTEATETTTETSAATTTTTTTASEEETATTNETVDLADMPQECIDAFVQYLQAIEPVVAGFDFETASIDDMEAIGTELDAVSAEQTTEMDSLDCPDPSGTDEESFAAMIDIAEREAPGTVPYFRWIESFAASFGGEGGLTSSGDCETDIEALEAIIAENETMGDLNGPEFAEATSLLLAITTECPPARAEEFFALPEVEAFQNMGG